jgi:hypothetical protein
VNNKGNDVLGFYLWTYGKTQNYQIITNYDNLKNNITSKYSMISDPKNINWLPNNSNIITISFSGWMCDPECTSEDDIGKNTAVGQGNQVFSNMKGVKYCSVGGGTPPGWTVQSISNLKKSIINDAFKNYKGVCFDIEIGDAGLAANFEDLFLTTKQKNLDVFITISHTAPFGFPDKEDLMKSFFKSKNVDIISPQLYTDDIGTATQYTPTDKFYWSDFCDAYNSRGNPNLQIYPSLWSVQSNNGCYDLWNTGGTNDGKQPIIGDAGNQPSWLIGQWSPDSKLANNNFKVDKGVKDFFNNILKIPSNGAIQFINGNISPL